MKFSRLEIVRDEIIIRVLTGVDVVQNGAFGEEAIASSYGAEVARLHVFDDNAVLIEADRIRVGGTLIGEAGNPPGDDFGDWFLYA